MQYTSHFVVPKTSLPFSALYITRPSPRILRSNTPCSDHRNTHTISRYSDVSNVTGSQSRVSIDVQRETFAIAICTELSRLRYISIASRALSRRCRIFRALKVSRYRNHPAMRMRTYTHTRTHINTNSNNNNDKKKKKRENVVNECRFIILSLCYILNKKNSEESKTLKRRRI